MQNGSGWVGKVLAWIGMAVLPSVAFSVPNAVSDEIHLRQSAKAFVDLLANDNNVTGRELSVTINSSGTQDFSVQDNGDGTIIVLRNAAVPSGDQTFTYTISDGVATDTANVRVCWGTALCPTSISDGSEDPPPPPGEDDPPPAPNACNGGICFVVLGSQFLPGQLVDLGVQPSGTEQTLSVSVQNHLGREVRLAAAVTLTRGDRTGLRFVATGDFGPLVVTIPAGGSASMDLRHIFLPAAPGDSTTTNLRGLFLVDKTDPQQDGTSWSLSFTDRGAGDFVIPDFEDCVIHDICLYVAGSKAGSVFGGTQSLTHQFGTVNVGQSASVVLQLVYNGVPGDGGGIPFQFIGLPDFNLIAGESAVTLSTVGIRQVFSLTLTWSPSDAGTLARDADFIVGNVGAHLKFRVVGEARLPGEACELCEITLDGVAFAHGSSVDFGSRPSGSSLRVRGSVRNAARRAANARLIVVGAQQTLFQLQGGFKTVAPGATVEFELLVLFRPGTNSARLELQEPNIGTPVYQSITLRATGTGSLPPVPGFEACPPTRFSYCLFVAGTIFDARHLPGQQPLLPPHIRPVHRLTRPDFFSETAVRAAIVNNLESTLPIQELRDQYGTIELSKDGAPLGVSSVGSRQALEFDVKFRSTFPLRTNHLDEQRDESDVGIVELIVGNVHDVMTALIAGCNCDYFDYGLAWARGPLVGTPGYLAAPGSQQAFKLVALTSAGESVRYFYSSDAETLVPHTRFKLQSTNSFSGPLIAVPPEYAYVDTVLVDMPATAGQTDKGFVGISQTASGGVPFGLGREDRVFAANPANQFEACTGVCVYRYVDAVPDRYPELTSASLVAVVGQQTGTRPVLKTFEVGFDKSLQFDVERAFVIANNSDAAKQIRIRINPRDATFALNKSWSGVTIHEYIRFIPPKRFLVGHLVVAPGGYIETDELLISDLGTGAQAVVDLVNDPGVPNGDCRDLCVSIGAGAYVPTGSGAPVTGNRQAATTATVRIINGAFEDRPFTFRLRGGDGFLSATDMYRVAGSACTVLASGNECAGTITGGEAVTLELTYRMDASRVGGFDKMLAETVVGTLVHTMTLHGSDCTGVCLTTGVTPVGSEYDFGFVQSSWPAFQSMVVVNATAAPVSLNGSLTGNYTLEGDGGEIPGFGERAIRIRALPQRGANAGTLTLRQGATGPVLATVQLKASGVSFGVVRHGSPHHQHIPH